MFCEARNLSVIDLDASTAPRDSSGPDMAAPDQKRSEGKGWTISNYCAAENTYTGKGGSKRD